MKRFFGGKKEAPPPLPSLTDATDTVNKRVGSLDDKIKALDKQLVDYKNQIKATRPGPAQNRIKQRAMQVLKQKRMYEQQRDQVARARLPATTMCAQPSCSYLRLSISASCLSCALPGFLVQTVGWYGVEHGAGQLCDRKQ